MFDIETIVQSVGEVTYALQESACLPLGAFNSFVSTVFVEIERHALSGVGTRAV